MTYKIISSYHNSDIKSSTYTKDKDKILPMFSCRIQLVPSAYYNDGVSSDHYRLLSLQ
nr:MAG TPA: hypothetical protein [Caudoviricetes sp.]